MAKLMYVYRSEEMSCVKIGRRQLPLIAGENLMMLMDLNSKGLVFDHPAVKGRELDEFIRKCSILSPEEFKQSLQVSNQGFATVLSQNVPCVGCRRSVERLYYQLMLSEHPALDPIVITKKGVLTVTDDKLKTPQAICTLLHKHNVLLNSLLENQPRNKKSSRCGLHSLDSFRSRPFSEMWRDVWDCMKQQCKEEVAVVEAQELHATLDGYLKKHKFCQECRTKVEKAYSLLVSENNPAKEKGYEAALYSGIKRCLGDKHIHLQTKVEYIDSLIKRAEPELNGRHRERHAKTLEIAQEEVLTCIGMCIYERLRRIHMCLKEEENACQVLAAVAVHSLCRSFDMAVETKRGISNLELLYEEISRAERAKEQRKEQKKLKKKKKKNDKKVMGINSHNCEPEPVSESGACSIDDDELENANDEMLHKEKIFRCSGKPRELPKSVSTGCCNIILNTDDNSLDMKDELFVSSCHSCENINGNVCAQSIDGGYVSEPSNHEGPCSILSSTANSRISSLASTPEGSEVACSDGFCNHDIQYRITRSHRNSPESQICSHTLSLQEMLGEFQSDDETEETSYIPDELVQEFKSKHSNLKQIREELRQNLRKNFAQLCLNKNVSQKVCTKKN